MKTNEAIQNVVDQCAADKICDEAYPDLGRIFTETLDKAARGEIVFQGEKKSVEFVLTPVNSRNGKYDFAPITRFIPAYIYELWRGKETPTVEHAGRGEASICQRLMTQGVEGRGQAHRRAENAGPAILDGQRDRRRDRTRLPRRAIRRAARRR